MRYRFSPLLSGLFFLNEVIWVGLLGVAVTLVCLLGVAFKTRTLGSFREIHSFSVVVRQVLVFIRNFSWIDGLII